MAKHTFLVRILLFLGMIDVFAASMVTTQLPLYLLSLKLSYFSSGLIGTIYGGVQLVSSPIVGNWSDSKGRKHCLILTLLCTAVSYLILGGTRSIIIIIIARIASGIFKHTHNLCEAYLVNVLKGSEMSQALGYYNSAATLGFIIGPAVGGHIAECYNGFFIICCISSALFFFNACIVLTFVPKEKYLENVKRITSQSSYSSLITVYWDILMVQFLLSFPIFLYRTNLPLQLRETSNVSVKILGYITSLQGFLNCLSSLFTGKFYHACKSTHTLLVMTASVQILSLWGLTFTVNMWFILILLTPLSFTNNIIKICMSNIIIDRKGGSKFGTIVGLGQSVKSSGRMLSPVAVGFLQQFSMYGPNIVGMFSSLLGVMLLVFNVCRIQQKSRNTKPKMS